MRRRNYGDNTQKLAGNEQIADEVSNNPHGIGYVGLAYLSHGDLVPVAIDGALPSLTAIRNGDYALSRPLYLIVDDANLAPVVEAFIDYILSPAGQALLQQARYAPVH